MYVDLSSEAKMEILIDTPSIRMAILASSRTLDCGTRSDESATVAHLIP